MGFPLVPLRRYFDVASLRGEPDRGCELTITDSQGNASTPVVTGHPAAEVTVIIVEVLDAPAGARCCRPRSTGRGDRHSATTALLIVRELEEWGLGVVGWTKSLGFGCPYGAVTDDGVQLLAAHPTQYAHPFSDAWRVFLGV